jgi:hypothetical protein
MDILCETFGYYLKHKKSNQKFMLQMQILHNFILFFSFNYFSSQLQNYGWRYCIHWTNYDVMKLEYDNGPSFSLYPHVEMGHLLQNWNSNNSSPCNSHIIFATNYIYVTILALGSQPRQKHGKVWAESVREWIHTLSSELPLWELESLWNLKSSKRYFKGQNSLY